MSNQRLPTREIDHNSTREIIPKKRCHSLKVYCAASFWLNDLFVGKIESKIGMILVSCGNGLRGLKTDNDTEL